MTAAPRLRIATANIACALDRESARECLDAVLAENPDVVLLQEWALKRLAILRGSGSISVVAPVALGEFGAGPYRWFAPVTGGCAVGVLQQRFADARARLRSLSLPGWSEGQLLQPGRTALEIHATDGTSKQSVAFVSYHLVSGAHHEGHYLLDRPHQGARHRHEHARLQRIIDRARGSRDVYAGGDANSETMEIAGMISAWRCLPDPPRRVDSIFAARSAEAIHQIETASDHRAVVVDY